MTANALLPASPRRLKLAYVAAVCVLLMAGCAPDEASTPGGGEPVVPVRALEAAVDSADAVVHATRALMERVRPLDDDEERRLRDLPYRPPYREHLAAGQRLGVDPVTSDAELQRLVEAGALVPLVDTEYYTVVILEHSAPFVTPATVRALEETGRRFQARLRERGLPTFRFAISSALRTDASQASLRAVNRNAALGTSSHEFGTCVDLAYTRYYYHPPAPDASPREDPLGALVTRLLEGERAALTGAYWRNLAGLLGRVLAEMQEEGTWLVLMEERQPVYHITLGSK